jgi:hypothetical protein
LSFPSFLCLRFRKSTFRLFPMNTIGLSFNDIADLRWLQSCVEEVYGAVRVSAWCFSVSLSLSLSLSPFPWVSIANGFRKRDYCIVYMYKRFRWKWRVLIVLFSCSGDDCSRSLQTRTSSIFCVCSIRTSMEDRRSCLPWPLSREWAGDSQTLYARRQTWTWVNGRFPRDLIRLWLHSLLCRLQTVVEIFLQSCRCVPYQTIMEISCWHLAFQASCNKPCKVFWSCLVRGDIC